MIVVPLTHSQLIWLFRGALLVTVMVVSWLAFTGSKVMMANLVSDKINHFAAFFVLSFLLDRSLPNLSFIKYKIWPLLAYGLFIEVIQSRLSYRDFSMMDIAADALALVVYWLLRNPMRKFVMAR